MKGTKKRIGKVEFYYEIKINGDAVAKGKVDEFLWLHLSRQELFFNIKDYPMALGAWVIRKLGTRRWQREYIENWGGYIRIAGTGDLIKRFRELVRMGWVKEPEKARTKLISALLLEESDEEGSGFTLHARVPA
jgi:hypothetical protein